jgi:hypothetical protein
MRAILERTGGFAGIKRTSVADTDDLTEAAAQKLMKLIEGAEFFALPETIVSKSLQPDRFEYTLTVEDGERTHTVTVGESSQPETLRALTEFLTHTTSR